MEDPAIIRLNIEHYRAMLRLDMSDERRQRVERQLAEAEVKLDGVENQDASASAPDSR
jgi:hypothetical protein